MCYGATSIAYPGGGGGMSPTAFFPGDENSLREPSSEEVFQFTKSHCKYTSVMPGAQAINSTFHTLNLSYPLMHESYSLYNIASRSPHKAHTKSIFKVGPNAV